MAQPGGGVAHLRKLFEGQASWPRLPTFPVPTDTGSARTKQSESYRELLAELTRRDAEPTCRDAENVQSAILLLDAAATKFETRLVDQH